jgi:AcrR family transcriptional regulator
VADRVRDLVGGVFGRSPKVQQWPDPWVVSPEHEPVATGEGLRERKKRLMRQQLSDVATGMFLERGFDAVRVAEVAEACGVSEKTVYNYFPTKESLLIDREEAMAASLRGALETGGSPVAAVLTVLDAEITSMMAHFASLPDPRRAVTIVQRFTDLIEATPSLRAHQRDMMERLVAAAAEALARRAAMSPEDPEPQVAASALLGLWRVQFRALERYADGSRTPDEVRDIVRDEVHRAARLVDTGLWSFGLFLQPEQGEQNHARAAAQAAEAARAQVKVALTEARNAWRSLRLAGKEHEDAERQAGKDAGHAARAGKKTIHEHQQAKPDRPPQPRPRS